MKTASWSLALAAGTGSVLAAVPKGYSEGPPAYDHSSSSLAAPVSSSQPAGYGSSSSHPAGPESSSSYVGSSSSAYGSSSSFAASGSSSYPAGHGSSSSFASSSASSSYPAGNQSCVSTYTSTCEETSTLIYRSTTSYTLETITHTLTTTYAGACDASSTPVHPISSSASVAHPSESFPALSSPVSYPTGSSPVSYSEGVPSSASESSYGSVIPSYPAQSNPAPTYPAQTFPGDGWGHPPAGEPSETYPADEPSSSYPANGPSTSYPAGAPSESYPADTPSQSYPAGSSSKSYPADAPFQSYSAYSSSERYRAGAPSASYPAGKPSASYPPHSVPEKYPASVEPSGPVVVTNTVTNTKYVCPCEASSDGSGAYLGSAEESSPVTLPPAGPTHTPGEVYVTHFTTEYETVLPGEDEDEIGTFTYGDAWTSIYTKSKISTVTNVITSTVTAPSYPDGGASPSGYPSGSAPAEGSKSGSAADGYPTASGSAPGEHPSQYPGAPGKPSGSASLPPYPNPSGHASSSYYPNPTGTQPAQPSGTGNCVPCQGQPGNDPEKWCGYTINDNWYEVMPKTCKTREYTFELTEIEISPDGIARPAQAINGQVPGPAIEANWGDTIVVHLTNHLHTGHQNGTSLHFHGMRQNGTNEFDGVPSITQCPIAPGHSMTYTFEASSYGTSWWHSHFGLQAYEGMFGPLVINGPAAAEYDEEQTVMLGDWNHIPVDSYFADTQVVGNPLGGPQTMDTALINGMNVWEGSGKRYEMTVTKGKSYRLRLVNTSLQSNFVFYVDGHKLEVIAMDFVPIKPYTTEHISINIGQRYDVILKADQESGDYWMRSDNQQQCAPLRNLDIKAIVHYADGPMSEPTSEQYTYAPTCSDEAAENLVPIVPWNVGGMDQTIDKSVLIGPSANPSIFKWTLSGTTFYAEWEHPTLKQIYEDGTIPDVSGNLAIEVPELHEWIYVIIQTVIPLPHPIHLHGHDFMILAQGLGSYNEGVALNLENPPRRDVAVMPADPLTGQPGYLVLAFQTSNPGIWLLHCHIGWHNAMGMALQIIENLEGISDTVKHGGMMEDTCSAWSENANAYSIVNNWDSGV
ncbi:hypothetical protein LTR37_015713 [Vermiconidia calcicola]|uniref:Uncharacterized protein n=1 Tax=Vermiconidia calcicola TaxID=1690605 RepID=A0ACC3MPX8_9PEZI|nr:hypothetical protein LTR37_015713 [Vermiconidia calcicola]